MVATGIVTLAVAVLLDVAVSLALTLAVALTFAVAFGLAVSVRLDTARDVTAALASVALAVVRLDVGRLRRLPGVSLLAVVPSVLVRAVHLLLLDVLRGRSLLLRARSDRVAVPEMRRERVLGDRDRHEGILLRVRVVADRHLRRRVLSIRGR
jgi:hypothetical protein